MRDKDRKLNDRAIKAIAELSSNLEGKEFIDPRDFTSLTKEYEQLDNDIHRKTGNLLSTMGFINKQLKANLDAFSRIYDNYPERLAEHNQDLARLESVEVGKCINPIEGYYLDEQQLTAIAYDVGSRLVIAGAGTGKTTTIVGFVKYLLRSGKALPEEILALSFTNASVDDLKKRIMAETGQRVDINTFHRLGLKIIASANGTVPKISNIKPKVWCGR